MQITVGSRVTMHFAIRLSDGWVAESSFDDEPLVFVMGEGTLDRGLELALYGLRPGDHQTLTLMPGQAFGSRDPAAVQPVPKQRFPADIQLQKGQIIGFSGEDGSEVAGTVLDLLDDEVTMDFNHPLAGREIEFEVRILDVQNPLPEQG